MTGEFTRTLKALMAAAVLLGASAGGFAMAKDHDDQGGRGNHRSEGRGPPPRGESRGYGQPRGGEWRGGPPPQAYGSPQGRYGRQGPPAGYAQPSPYGPPPGYAAAPPESYSPRGYGVRRGGYLPPDLRGGMIQDYGRYRLRPPPRGYTWVQVGGGFALVEMGSGQIFDIVPY